MPNDTLERRQKKNVSTKPAQLTGLGILTPDKDQEGNKIQIQPTITARPNALQVKAFQQGNLGSQVPRAGLADMAIQANQAISNQTASGLSAAALGAGLGAKKKKKQKPGGLEGGYGA